MKFRMVDRILAWQPRQHIRGIKTVSFEEYQLKAAFADQPHLPQTLVMESLFQLGNWLIMLSSDFSQMGLIVRFLGGPVGDGGGASQIDLLNLGVGLHVGDRPFGDHLPACQHRYRCRKRAHEIHIMLDDHNCALSTYAAQQVPCLLAFFVAHPGDRLVE